MRNKIIRIVGAQKYSDGIIAIGNEIQELGLVVLYPNHITNLHPIKDSALRECENIKANIADIILVYNPDFIMDDESVTAIRTSPLGKPVFFKNCGFPNFYTFDNIDLLKKIEDFYN